MEMMRKELGLAMMALLSSDQGDGRARKRTMAKGRILKTAAYMHWVHVGEAYLQISTCNGSNKATAGVM